MDVEKTIEFLLDTQARHDAQLAEIREAQRAGQARHDAQLTEIRAAQQENDRLLAQTIQLVANIAEVTGQHNRRIQSLEGSQS